RGAVRLVHLHGQRGHAKRPSRRDGGPPGPPARGVGERESGGAEPYGGRDGAVGGYAAGRERHAAQRTGGDVGHEQRGGGDGEWERVGDGGGGGDGDDHGDE